MRFRSLAVAVVDEQHRFGVRQRDGAGRQGAGGPRAARPAHDGDADPAHARAVRVRRPRPDAAARAARAAASRSTTHVISGERERARAYERIARGGARPGARRSSSARSSRPPRSRQDAAAARRARRPAEFERLRAGELRDFRLVLLHGQLGHREKQAAMAAFAAGEADVLVATTVIEVGIDVPNATVMLVENAERFGISQLHQLRGRVGRGEHASLCLLCGPKGSPRLQALAAPRRRLRARGDRPAPAQARASWSARGSRASAGSRSRSCPRTRALLAAARACAEALIAADPAARRARARAARRPPRASSTARSRRTRSRPEAACA